VPSAVTRMLPGFEIAVDDEMLMGVAEAAQTSRNSLCDHVPTGVAMTICV